VYWLAPLPDCPSAQQSIATTGNRLQQYSIRAERLANRGYVKLQRIFLNDRALPHAAHEVVLVDEFTARLNENLNDLECAAPKGNGNSTRPQFTLSEIDLPPMGRVHSSSALFGHFAIPALRQALLRTSQPQPALD
jgi:hypothetical protein